MGHMVQCISRPKWGNPKTQGSLFGVLVVGVHFCLVIIRGPIAGPQMQKLANPKLHTADLKHASDVSNNIIRWKRFLTLNLGKVNCPQSPEPT